MALWHITTSAEWDEARALGEHRPASLATEGFVHLSSDSQWGNTAGRFFKGRTGLVLLKIDEAKLKAEVRWEAADGDRFPHLYGPLNVDAVIAATPLIVDPPEGR
ncbi:MAG: DUF952 domain-containing protein [Archangiaceae bacterium]|nr:DUF952 domain-containing protein [Archangiaceae bacterium]